MIHVSRELSLRVVRDIWHSNVRHYCLDENVTVLMNDDTVAVGVIKSIGISNFALLDDTNHITIIEFEKMVNIANTDWLGDCDIREEM